MCWPASVPADPVVHAPRIRSRPGKEVNPKALAGSGAMSSLDEEGLFTDDVNGARSIRAARICPEVHELRASGRTTKHLHHAVAGVVVYLVEFEFDRHNMDLEANPLKVIEDGTDVGRPVAV